MKIAIIIPSLHMGGGEKFAVELANELSKNKNNEVTLCVLSIISTSMILKKRIDNKVTLVSLNKNIGFSLITIFKLKKFLKNQNFDIVHTHLRTILYTSLSIVTLKNIQYVHTFHTLIEKEARNRSYRFLLKSFFNYYPVTPVAIGHTVLKGMQLYFGEMHKQLILNGVSPIQLTPSLKAVEKEISSYKKPNDSKIFLSISRVTKVKNQKLLIETFSQLEKNNILLIIGSLTNEYSYAQECQKLARKRENIIFLGEKNNVGDYLYYADALCLSSHFEGLPLVILEAMSLGKPILSTKVGGIPDILSDTKIGYLSKDMSVEAYIEIINQFNHNSSTNKKHILTKFQENFSMEICAKAYYKLYKHQLIKETT